MKNKKHIAMRCKQEQFEAIKPKLEKSGYEFDIYDFKTQDFLCVHLDNEKLITNYSKLCLNENKRIIHEEWNEKIFLEACGIELEPKFEITKEQILELYNTGNPQPTIRKMFPEVFKPVLEAGKWYKTRSSLFNHQENSKSYGFMCGKWVGEWSTNPNLFNVTPIEATPEEVTEALKKEAVRLGVRLGAYIHRQFDLKLSDCVIDEKTYFDDKEFYYNPDNDYLEHHGFVIYSKGQWATVIQTITIQEAEELLK